MFLKQPANPCRSLPTLSPPAWATPGRRPPLAHHPSSRPGLEPLANCKELPRNRVLHHLGSPGNGSPSCPRLAPGRANLRPLPARNNRLFLLTLFPGNLGWVTQGHAPNRGSLPIPAPRRRDRPSAALGRQAGWNLPSHAVITCTTTFQPVKQENRSFLLIRKELRNTNTSFLYRLFAIISDMRGTHWAIRDQ